MRIISRLTPHTVLQVLAKLCLGPFTGVSSFRLGLGLGKGLELGELEEKQLRGI